MKLKISKENYIKFKELKNIKENPWIIELSLIKKTIKYVNYIKWIPWLKMIAIWNSVAMNNANNNSDIDLFIITDQKRLWLTRIIITFIFQILWIRKTKNKHKERFCLSFFITTNSLSFENIKIENDIYLYFWILYLKPILNYDNSWKNFLKANEEWCDFDNYQRIKEYNQKYIKYKKAIFTNNLNWTFLDYTDNLFKKIFLKRALKKAINLWNPFGIIINDDILKFHDNDTRIEIRDKIFTN